MEESRITIITTTADLFGHIERILHIEKLSSTIKTDYVRMETSAGTHLYKKDGGYWKPVVK